MYSCLLRSWKKKTYALQYSIQWGKLPLNSLEVSPQKDSNCSANYYKNAIYLHVKINLERSKMG